MREIGTLSYYKPLIAKKVFMHHYLFLANRELPEFFLEPDSFGLDREKISLSETHRQWKRLYEFEEIQIRETLNGEGETARVYNVGSTGVDDFIARPIIDILLEYEAGAVVEDIICSLEGLGYRHKGENGIPGREYFVKGTERTTYFHLHAFKKGADDAANHKKVVSVLAGNPYLPCLYRRQGSSHEGDSLLQGVK